METGITQVYFGNGAGKTSAALGNAVRAASEGKVVYIIQFLKGQLNSDYLKKLEPEVKVFCFERSENGFDELSEEEKAEEAFNIKNGLGFARKVLSTGECDILVLDEVLGIIDEGIVTEKEFIAAIENHSPGTTVILTGRTLPERIRGFADKVLEIVERK
ncbi:MAG: cob(I)yrinic acid a,c-diamide adenosyltransferase [Lachnospiraceae bacterium]|nr:cob(I)yrinic acid a,c-diamide adenosyltransferase [Lachnospiraceae bacterium]